MLSKNFYRIAPLAMISSSRWAYRCFVSASVVDGSRDGFIHIVNLIRTAEREKNSQYISDANAASTHGYPDSRNDSFQHPTIHDHSSMRTLATSLCQSYLMKPPLPSSDSIYSSISNRTDSSRFDILHYLAYDCGVDVEEVLSFMQRWSLRDYPIDLVEHWRVLCRPLYERILKIVASEADRGLALSFLVQLRGDTICKIQYLESNRFTRGSCNNDYGQEIDRLKVLDREVKDLLKILFKAECLELKRISIDQTPEVILEKIASRDAVHPIKCTDDLKKRLSTSRRCYALFHHSIPNEPLVILHTAMLDRIPSNLDDLNRGKIEESVKNQVAVFYSITNAFPGLVGLDLGCFLIKSVLKIIDSEYQDGDTVFVTLSPIPGFRKWLVENKTRILNDQDFFVQTADEKEQMMTLLEMNFDDQLDSVMQQKIKLIHDAQPILMRLAAHYLYHEKENKLPLDKVARFHMRNGASIFRLNFFADTSTRGMSNSFGIMVNYRYDSEVTEANRRQK